MILDELKLESYIGYDKRIYNGAFSVVHSLIRSSLFLVEILLYIFFTTYRVYKHGWFGMVDIKKRLFA